MNITPYSQTQMANKQINRRETKTERKQLMMKPSLASALNSMVTREDTTETDVVTRAIEKEVRSIPLLGDIPCGPMGEVLEDYEDLVESWVNVGDLLKVREGDFLLRARGDSMTGDGVFEGDLIHIRPQQSCDSGEVAAVLVDTPMGTRSTLKRVEYGTISPIVKLIPMNDAHEVIEIDLTTEKLRICGVKRGVIRMH